MSWHHHHLLCGRPETLPANNISDRCATVDKVLPSLAMPTSVHDDTKLVCYSICHIEPVQVVMQDLSRVMVKLSRFTDDACEKPGNQH